MEKIKASFMEEHVSWAGFTDTYSWGKMYLILTLPTPKLFCSFNLYESTELNMLYYQGNLELMWAASLLGCLLT